MKEWVQLAQLLDNGTPATAGVPALCENQDKIQFDHASNDRQVLYSYPAQERQYPITGSGKTQPFHCK
jgi:hypothetical protein